MKILALPSPASDFYSVSAKDFLKARQGRLPLVGFADQSSQVVAD
jgi:hypothetical protein